MMLRQEQFKLVGKINRSKNSLTEEFQLN